MGKLIDGNKIARRIETALIKKIRRLKSQTKVPKLVVVLGGADKSSRKYVEKKRARAEKIGVLFELKKFPASVTTRELLAAIRKIQTDQSSNGLIVQLPLPKQIDKNKILNAVRPEIDVDCLNAKNQLKLAKGQKTFLPPTPAAILEILKSLKIKFKNKTVAVIGQGRLVGKPITAILRQRGARVKVGGQTTDLKKLCLDADIIITGAGKKNLVTKAMVRKDAVVIDAGITFVGKKLYGDADWKNIQQVAKYVTPTPGGVGPITVSCLLRNVVENTK